MDRAEVLVELTRDADPQTAARAMDYLHDRRLHRELENPAPVRAYLLAVVDAAMAEEREDQDKGEAALRLLIEMELDERATAALLDYIDPFQHIPRGEVLETDRQLNDYDRRLLDLYLISALRTATEGDLLQLCRSPVSLLPFEIGRGRYVEVLVTQQTPASERRSIRSRSAGARPRCCRPGLAPGLRGHSEAAEL